MKFKLALVQQRVDGGRKSANLSRAVEWIAQAAGEGAQVIVLPETLSLGWMHPSAATEADEVPDGVTCTTLAEAARVHGVFVCAGLVERAGEKIYNAAVLLDPRGEVLLHHRKINELDIAHDCYALGDRLAVAHTPLGTFGVMICADAFAREQVISRSLGYMGAQVILSPCAWAVPPDHNNSREPYGGLWLANYGPVARDFRLWIAGVSNVGLVEHGLWAGHRCIGCSLLVGPGGEKILQGPYGADAETILYADVAPVVRPAQGDSWARQWAAAS